MCEVLYIMNYINHKTCNSINLFINVEVTYIGEE